MCRCVLYPSKIKGVFSARVEAKFLSEWSWVKQSASTASLSYTHLHNNSEDAKSQNTNFLFAAHWNTDGGGGGEAQGTFNIMSLHTGRLCIIFHLFLCVWARSSLCNAGRVEAAATAMHYSAETKEPRQGVAVFPSFFSLGKDCVCGAVFLLGLGFCVPEAASVKKRCRCYLRLDDASAHLCLVRFRVFDTDQFSSRSHVVGGEKTLQIPLFSFVVKTIKKTPF